MVRALLQEYPWHLYPSFGGQKPERSEVAKLLALKLPLDVDTIEHRMRVIDTTSFLVPKPKVTHHPYAQALALSPAASLFNHAWFVHAIDRPVVQVSLYGVRKWRGLGT